MQRFVHALLLVSAMPSTLVACGEEDCPPAPGGAEAVEVAWEELPVTTLLEPCRFGFQQLGADQVAELSGAEDLDIVVDAASCSPEERSDTPLARRLASLPEDRRVIVYQAEYGGCFQNAVLDSVYRAGDDDLVVNVLVADLRKHRGFNGACTLDRTEMRGVLEVESTEWIEAKVVVSLADPDTCAPVALR